ncbi:MAG: hypothetical protein N2438_14385, partial [Limisphaera sp.]|nr:hypothetical protein [Limisphaera sp.]
FNNAKNNGCIYSDILFNNDTIRVFNLHLQSYNLYKKKKWKPYQKTENESFYESLDSSAKGMNIFQKMFHNSILKTQQAENILLISQQSSLPTLIIGDFNDIPHSYLMRLFRNKFTDAFVEKGNGLGITYHDKIYLRIDYIFHDSSFRNIDFETDNNEETSHLSDHYPVRCVFELKKKQ